MLEIPDILDVPDVYFEGSDVPSCPELTLLYGLRPHGIGTEACQSLKSYIGELANAHRVTPRTLIKEVLRGKLVEYNLAWNEYNMWKFRGNSSSYVGMTETARGLTNVLIEATGIKELEYCSMLPLRGVFNNRGLITSQERHCPLCLQETVEASSLHGSLLWDVACVTACHIHRVQLVPSECGASKDKHVTSFRRKILSGVCSACGSIGYRCRKETATLASEVEVWKAQQVGELIACFPRASGLFLKQNTIDGLISLVATLADGKPAVAARRAGIRKSVLWGWMKGVCLPSLESLLYLCLTAGVSLVSVLEGRATECFCPPHVIKPAKSRNKTNKEELKNALGEALTVDPPKSLKSIALALGVSRMLLPRYFPELSALVVERFRQFKSLQLSEQHKQVRELGERLKKELIDKRLPLTQGNFEIANGKRIMPTDLLYKILGLGRNSSQN